MLVWQLLLATAAKKDVPFLSVHLLSKWQKRLQFSFLISSGWKEGVVITSLAKSENFLKRWSSPLTWQGNYNELQISEGKKHQNLMLKIALKSPKSCHPFRPMAPNLAIKFHTVKRPSWQQHTHMNPRQQITMSFILLTSESWETSSFSSFR